MVVPFLFYSGYGVMESIKRKGLTYVKGLPKNRILKVLLIYEFVNVFKILVKLILNGGIGLDYIILSTLSWYDWYVFAILLLYIFTYLAYLVFRDRNNYILVVLSVVILTAGYITIFYLLDRSRYFYDTVLCYSVGLLWSIYKEKLNKIFAKNYIFYPAFIILGLLALVLKFKLQQYEVVVFITYGIIAVLLVLFTKKVQINNPILNWGGVHLFDIYLVHRIPMDIFYALKINLINNYLYMGLCIICTIVMVVLLDLTINKWVKKLLNNKKVDKKVEG